MGAKKARKRKSSVSLLLLLLILLTLACAAGWVLYQELYASRLQARLLHRYASRMTFALEEGSAPRTLRAPSGPYDIRLGYASLPVLTRNLTGKGFRVSRQVRVSQEMWNAAQSGLFPPYREKSRAGLRILDRNGLPIYSHSCPSRTFSSFSEIPPLIVEMLLFVENRGLLDPHRPRKNNEGSGWWQEGRTETPR